MRGQGRQTSAVTGERHDGRAPFGVHLSCTIEIVTRLCPDGDAPWRACSWVCVSGPAARARASRRVAWSCEFSSSMGAGMWSPRTPRTRRACLGLLRDRTRSYEASLPGRGRRGASVVTVDPGARASTGGRSILNFDARRSVLLSTLGRRERVWSALCCWTGLGSGHGGSLAYTASRHPCVPSSKINGFKAATNLIPCLILTTRNINIHTVPTNMPTKKIVRTSGGGISARLSEQPTAP